MKIVPPAHSDEAQTQAADLKTLRLAAPLLTPELLGRYLSFQRAYVDFLEAHPDRRSALAEAHAHAAKASGASIDEIGRLGALCTDFAGRRGVELKLLEHQRKVRASIQEQRDRGQAASERDLEIERKIAEELAQGSAHERLAARYGPEAIEVLRAREGEILELHRRQLAVHL